MSMPIKMPNLGAETDEARVSVWLKGIGESALEGEVIAEIETEKASVDLEAPAAGHISEILVPAGADAKVGTVLATFEED
jgi:pyruvate/2-oxoglutarate dehydrogenase complex dihydrolipoamide acyltransferase (E2) component